LRKLSHRKKAGLLSIQTTNASVRIPRIEFHECEECKERFFDYEASKILDEYCLEKTAVKKR
jgi:hypothetical protein